VIAFSIKQNDTAPSIAATLKDSGGLPVDLTGAQVKFIMATRPNGAQVEHDAAKVDAAASIVDAAAGEVRYDWQATDTDTAGVFDAEWEVTYASGAVETFPSGEYLIIKVLEDLG
jgi:hypothetical protein